MKEVDSEMNYTVAIDLECLHFRRLPTVDFVGSPGVEGRVRSVSVVPIGEEKKLASKLAPAEWHEDLSSAFVLECENEALHDGDATDFPEFSEMMVDLNSSAPILEASADELTALVGDDAVRHYADSCHRSRQECADGKRCGMKQEDVGALDSAGETVHGDHNPPTERPALWGREGSPRSPEAAGSSGYDREVDVPGFVGSGGSDLRFRSGFD